MIADFLTNRKILLGDDDPDARILMTDSLLQLEPTLEIQQSVNGEEVIQHLETTEPDLLILDLRMPVLDGFETLEIMLKRGLGEYVPILVLTAYGHQDIVAEAVELGADAFQEKPITTLELQSKVRALLRIRYRYEILRGH